MSCRQRRSTCGCLRPLELTNPDSPSRLSIIACVSGIPSALSTVLDGIGASDAEGILRALLAAPDSPPSVSAAMPKGAVNYAICYIQRSGSTHLTSLLQNAGVAGESRGFLQCRLPLYAAGLWTKADSVTYFEEFSVTGR
jgi:hypothetical protein